MWLRCSDWSPAPLYLLIPRCHADCDQGLHRFAGQSPGRLYRGPRSHRSALAPDSGGHSQPLALLPGPARSASCRTPWQPRHIAPLKASSHGAVMATQTINALIYAALALTDLAQGQPDCPDLRWHSARTAALSGANSRQGRSGSDRPDEIVAVGETDQMGAVKPLKAMARESHIDALMSSQTRDLNRTQAPGHGQGRADRAAGTAAGNTGRHRFFYFLVADEPADGHRDG